MTKRQQILKPATATKLVATALSFMASTALVAPSASAEENLWIYATGTDTRPQGSFEVKLETIYRVGKKGGSYRFADIRPSIEYGITDKLTVGFELALFHHNYSVTDPDLLPFFDTQGGEGGSFNNFSIGGYDFELKYNVLSPYKDAFGFSFGVEYDHRDRYRLDGAAINQDSVEIALFFQKNFLDDTLVFVFNPKIELENRRSGEGVDFVLEEEIALDIAAGVSYRIAPKWFIGLEYRHQSDYLVPRVIDPITGGLVFDEPNLKPSDIDILFPSIGSQFQSGNYFGPTVHYAEEKWWATAGILFQFSGGGREGSFNVGNRNFDEQEKVHIGLSFGYNF
ncbi:MAG: hypothetical protein JKY60_19975 [Kordiimonadaceae bacterium]|nr:hypothetical protein [Kordiimonadaceae bacterium]